MTEPILVMNRTIEIFNFNFYDIATFKDVPDKMIVQTIIFTQVFEDDSSSHNYERLGVKATAGECLADVFYHNLMDVINMFPRVENLVLDNFQNLKDAHFSRVHLLTWNRLVSFSVTKCPKVKGTFFSWVADNCYSIVKFEFTCNPFLDPMCTSHPTEKTVFHPLAKCDLMRFFVRNCCTLKKVVIQLENICWVENLHEGEGVANVICKCKKLEHIELIVKTGTDLDQIAAISILLLPCLIVFKHTVKKVNMIDYVSEDDGTGGCLSLFSNYGSIQGAIKNALLAELFRGLKFRLKDVTMSGLVGVSGEVIKSIAMSNPHVLRSVKILNCGDSFDITHVELLVKYCKNLKLVVVFDGCRTFGDTDIEFRSSGVVIAMKMDNMRWTLDAVRQHKKKLECNDYAWLCLNAVGGYTYKSDNEDEE
jgi:hypothetical protein